MSRIKRVSVWGDTPRIGGVTGCGTHKNPRKSGLRQLAVLLTSSQLCRLFLLSVSLRALIGFCCVVLLDCVRSKSHELLATVFPAETGIPSHGPHASPTPPRGSNAGTALGKTTTAIEVRVQCLLSLSSLQLILHPHHSIALSYFRTPVCTEG